MSKPQKMNSYMDTLAQGRKKEILGDLESIGYRLGYFGSTDKIEQRVQGLKWDGERNGLTEAEMSDALERGKAEGVADSE